MRAPIDHLLNPQLYAYVGGVHTPISDPLELLAPAMIATAASGKWPSLTIEQRFREERDHHVAMKRGGEMRYVAGIDFERRLALPVEVCERAAWFWPLRPGRPLQVDINEPRYRTLSDALVVSLRMNDGDVTRVAALSAYGHGGYHEGVITRRGEFFDDPDWVAPGTMQAWWLAWLRDAPVSAPVRRRGDDDEMRWDR